MAKNESEGLTISGRNRDEDLRKLTRAWIEELQWEDCEYGAWSNDPKRPFGNSGNRQIAEDILEIIGLKDGSPRCPHYDEVLDEAAQEKLHNYAHDLFKAIPLMLARMAER